MLVFLQCRMKDKDDMLTMDRDAKTKSSALLEILLETALKVIVSASVFLFVLASHVCEKDEHRGPCQYL